MRYKKSHLVLGLADHLYEQQDRAIVERIYHDTGLDLLNFSEEELEEIAYNAYNEGIFSTSSRPSGGTFSRPSRSNFRSSDPPKSFRERVSSAVEGTKTRATVATGRYMVSPTRQMSSSTPGLGTAHMAASAISKGVGVFAKMRQRRQEKAERTTSSGE